MTASTSVVNPMQVEYDRELPAEHAYLGALERVRGMQCLEAGQTYCIPVFVHNSLVFPGETIPMIARNFFFSNLQDHTTEDGILFGLVFPNLWSLTVPHLYGVTCQVFEKGTGEQSMQIKSRAGHRFKIRRSGNANFEELLMFGGNGKHMFANIEILPEVVLPDPLYATGSAARFGLNPSMTKRLRRYTAASTPWPTFLYDQYNIEETVKDVKTFLSDLKLDVAVSDDPVALSFWLAQNIPLSHSDRVRTFLANSVTSRMLIIGQSLDVGKYFCCRRCKTKVANYNSIFAMSREGVQSKYCNPSGYIHETNTVYNVLPGTVILQGAVYSEFSWFPGYKWQIANCCACNNHLGWEFTTKVRTYVPQSFFGLSGKSLVLESSITRKNEEQERLSMMIGSDSTTEFDSMETLSE